MDIDHFKEINDYYGHLEGDECLKSIAQIIRSHVKRKTDYVSRIGGEEFALLLPGSSLEDATALAEAIREDVESQQLLPVDGRHATVSAGIASTSPEELKVKNLIDAADHALYSAKESGRNQVRVAS